MEKRRIFSLSSVLFCGILFLILFLLFYIMGFLPKPIAATGPRVMEIPVDADQNSMLLAPTEDLGDEYIEKMIFLGESTTYGLWHYGVLPQGKNSNQVWTGATVQNGNICCAGTLSLSPALTSTRIFYPDTREALTVSEALARKKPEILVITLGLNNGASYYTEDAFKQCYRSLLNSVISSSEDTVILLQSIFPVARSCQIKAYTPERLTLCNQWIYDLALEYGIRYLDTASALADEEGYLKAEYDNGGDGIHLNREGLMAVLLYIRTHGYQEDL